jgi:hypothetical protein
VTTDVPLEDRIEGLQETSPTRTSSHIKLDGVSAYKSNMLTIDFFKDDFERPRSQLEDDFSNSLETGDPPLRLAFEIANDFLGHLRSLSGSHVIKLLTKDENCWLLDYLDDEGQQLPLEATKFRRRFQSPIRGSFAVLTKEMWDKINSLESKMQIPIWETLLFDARALLPHVGPAIVVANAALECFIPWALDRLQEQSKIPPELWNWIYGRKDWYQGPSVEEQYDILLKVLSGRSLKEDNERWEAFKKLREARNKFSHEGRPSTGKRKTEVTLPLAEHLIESAVEIVQWAEALLPEAVRRPKPLLASLNIQHPIHRPHVAYQTYIQDVKNEVNEDHIFILDIEKVSGQPELVTITVGEGLDQVRPVSDAGIPPEGGAW